MRLKKFVILAAMSFFSLCAYADITVKGVVVDDSGETIIGASVVEKGNPSNGVATDIDGAFTLTVPSANSEIEVSYIGMEAQVLKASTKEMRIVMSPNAQQLDEVVVTGMSKMDRRLFTGATTQIDADKAKLDGVADIARALEGRSAGVSV